jgi:hypothetical protein
MRLRGGFLAIFMRTPAMSSAHWPKPKLSNNHAFGWYREDCVAKHRCFFHLGRFAALSAYTLGRPATPYKNAEQYDMKRIFKLDRLRLRGLSGAKDEVLLTATAQNLRRLIRIGARTLTA